MWDRHHRGGDLGRDEKELAIRTVVKMSLKILTLSSGFAEVPISVSRCLSQLCLPL